MSTPDEPQEDMTVNVARAIMINFFGSMFNIFCSFFVVGNWRVPSGLKHALMIAATWAVVASLISTWKALEEGGESTDRDFVWVFLSGLVFFPSYLFLASCYMLGMILL